MKFKNEFEKHKLVFQNVVTDDGITGIEKLFYTVLMIFSCISIGFFIKNKFYNSNIKIHTDIYVITKTIFVLILLLLPTTIFSSFVALCFMCETFVYLLTLVFLRNQFEKVENRASSNKGGIGSKKPVILLFFNYFELISGFAVLYKFFNVVSNELNTSYFFHSLLTSLTFNISSLNISSFIQRFIIGMQILVSFVILTLIINYCVTLLSRNN